MELSSVSVYEVDCVAVVFPREYWHIATDQFSRKVDLCFDLFIVDEARVDKTRGESTVSLHHDLTLEWFQ